MRFRHLVRALCIVALAATSSCSGSLLTGSDGGRQADYAAARARWNAIRPAKYEYTLSIACFCAFSRPVVIAVDGTTVVSRTYADDGTPFSASFATSFTSVDGLFDVIGDAINRKASTLQSSYDATTGIPVDINIDYAVNVADDEISYHASNFKVR